MNRYRRLLKDFASKYLPEENRSDFTFNSPKIQQISLPFVSVEKLRSNDYYGEIHYNILERRPFVLDYNEGMTEGKNAYFTKVRRKLRTVLSEHISAVEDDKKSQTSLEIDFCNHVFTKLPTSKEDIPIPPKDLLATDVQTSNSSVFKRFSLNRVQMQCCDSEYKLLESLRRCGAVLTEVICSPDEVVVCGDYGFTAKSTGIATPLRTNIHLNPVTLIPEEWECLSWSPSTLSVITPSHLEELCGLCIKTHVTKRIKLLTEDQKNFVSRSSDGQFCTEPDSGIKSVTVNFERRTYTLKLGTFSFLLRVCQRRVYRVRKETGSTWLACRGTCIPSIQFPSIDGCNVDDLSRTIALMCIKILRESSAPKTLNLKPIQHFLLSCWNNSSLHVPCELFQQFRWLNKGKLDCERSSDDKDSQSAVQFETWLKAKLTADGKHIEL